MIEHGPGAESYITLRELQLIPDAGRDARRAAYTEAERRKAARALDRYIETVMRDDTSHDFGPFTGAAGERLIQAVGDYVLARLGGNQEEVEPDVQGD